MMAANYYCNKLMLVGVLLGFCIVADALVPGLPPHDVGLTDMERVSLRKLPSSSREHFIRVQVVRIFEPIQNEGKARFQRIVLKDDEGDKVKLTLFGENIDIYSSILREDAIYDVSNVTMKYGGSEYGSENERLMYVHDSSSFVPSSEESLSSFMPDYIMIFTANAINSVTESFDLAAIVVRVGSLEGKRTRSGRLVDMAKLYLTDESCDDVVPVVLWGSAAQEGSKFVGQSDVRGVIAFHGLCKNIFRGDYSFTAGYDCRVCLAPKGRRVAALEAWLAINAGIVISRQQAFDESEPLRPPVQTGNIGSITALTVDGVAADTLYKVHVKVSSVDSRAIRVAFGCSHCGRRCDYVAGEKYVCSDCNKAAFCIAKLYFDFEATDASGTLALSAHTRAAEQLLGVRAQDFSKKTSTERDEIIMGLRNDILSRTYSIVLSPVASFLRDHGIVKWALKYVDSA